MWTRDEWWWNLIIVIVVFFFVTCFVLGEKTRCIGNEIKREREKRKRSIEITSISSSSSSVSILWWGWEKRVKPTEMIETSVKSIDESCFELCFNVWSVVVVVVVVAVREVFFIGGKKSLVHARIEMQKIIDDESNSFDNCSILSMAIRTSTSTCRKRENREW